MCFSGRHHLTNSTINNWLKTWIENIWYQLNILLYQAANVLHITNLQINVDHNVDNSLTVIKHVACVHLFDDYCQYVSDATSDVFVDVRLIVCLFVCFSPLYLKTYNIIFYNFFTV